MNLEFAPFLFNEKKEVDSAYIPIQGGFMLSFQKAVWCVFLIIGVSFSQPEVNAMKQYLESTAGVTKGLLKSTIASATLTSYTNSTFNVTYTAPTGWSFNTPTVSGNMVSWSATDPSYVATMYFEVAIYSDSLESAMDAQAGCFAMVSSCYKAASMPFPEIAGLSDSFFTSVNYGAQAIYVEYRTSYADVGVCFANHCGQYVTYYYFFTTVTDFNANNSVYFQNYLNLHFITYWPSAVIPQIPKTSINGIIKPYATSNGIILPGVQGKDVNMNICDLLGRKIAGLSLSNSGEQTFLPKAGAAYILQLKEQGQQLQSTIIPFAR